MKPSKKSEFNTLRLRLNPSSPFTTILLVKQFDPKGEKTPYPTERALFIAGLPADFDEAILSHVFSAFGSIATVVLHPSKTSGIVVFENSNSLSRTITQCQKGLVVATPEFEHDDSKGLKKWVESHKAERPGNDVLEAQLDAWMAAYEEEEERKQRESAAAMAGDGWTVVVRSKGRKRTREEDGVAVNTGGVSAAAAAATVTDKAPQVYDDFYRFQKRDKRRHEVLELQQKFAAGKQRIAELRAARKFRPY